jgi:uncharacterized OB-fold protein
MSERIVVQHTMDLTWRYASGEAMERFCAGLRERRIEALRCEGCARRYLPPRPMCGNCRRRLSEWVPVSDEGTLVAFTVVHIPILDGRSGEMRPAPYGMGLIRLEGADTTLNHFLADADPARLRIDSRVRAVWRPELVGAMDDILHFEPVRARSEEHSEVLP